MNDRLFWDTNVVIYYATNAAGKLPVLQAVLDEGREVLISAQVLNEFSNVAFKKLGFTHLHVAAQVNAFLKAFTVAPLLPAYTLRAIELKHRYGFSYYDSLIVATALENGCSRLYSEDMHNGLIVDTLTIINPFV